MRRGGGGRPLNSVVRRHGKDAASRTATSVAWTEHPCLGHRPWRGGVRVNLRLGSTTTSTPRNCVVACGRSGNGNLRRHLSRRIWDRREPAVHHRKGKHAHIVVGVWGGNAVLRRVRDDLDGCMETMTSNNTFHPGICHADPHRGRRGVRPEWTYLASSSRGGGDRLGLRVFARLANVG